MSKCVRVWKIVAEHIHKKITQLDKNTIECLRKLSLFRHNSWALKKFYNLIQNQISNDNCLPTKCTTTRYICHMEHHTFIKLSLQNVEIISSFRSDFSNIKLVILLHPIFAVEFAEFADFCDFGKIYFNFWQCITS